MPTPASLCATGTHIDGFHTMTAPARQNVPPGSPPTDPPDAAS